MIDTELRNAHATLAALTAARRAMEGHADETTATHLLMSLLVLKVAGDAAVDRRLRSGDAAPEDGPVVPAGARALVCTSAVSLERLHLARPEGLGARVRAALDLLARDNPDALEGVFAALDLDAGMPSDRSLQRLLARLSIPALDFRARHGLHRPDLAEAVDQLLEHPVHRRARGRVPREPDPLATLMAELLAPADGETVYDPVFRRGCCLLAVAGGGGGGARAGREGHVAPTTLHGQDPCPKRSAVARLRLLLHGENTDRLDVADPLRCPPDPAPGAMAARYPVAVSNPPLTLGWDSTGAPVDPRGRFWQGIAPRQWAHFPLIQHMLAGLDPHCGRLGVVVPQGVLFRAGEEERIRRALIEANEVDTVIHLPDRQFTGTSVSTAVLVLRKARTDHSVLFVDTRPLLDAAGKAARLDATAIQRVLMCCSDRRSVPGVSHRVPVEEVLATGGVLNVSRYVQPAQDAAEHDLEGLCRRCTVLRDELNTVQAALERDIETLATKLRDAD